MPDSIEIPKTTAHMKPLDDFLESISNPRVREFTWNRIIRKYDAQQFKDQKIEHPKTSGDFIGNNNER